MISEKGREKMARIFLDESNDIHVTQNLWEAGYLIAKGLKILSIDREGKRSKFNFNHPMAKKYSIEYWNNEPIGAKNYSDAYRTLKDMLFDTK